MALIYLPIFRSLRAQLHTKRKKKLEWRFLKMMNQLMADDDDDCALRARETIAKNNLEEEKEDKQKRVSSQIAEMFVVSALGQEKCMTRK